ncbi:hypothetical protein [Bacillus piscicola]|uniref:hypothetical protein n=1 Tax=Bacillus piscicola TaxID=1632684 RepID=UPI001F08D362|nr:hypothetical protein [Bacillus piscicola]
MIAISKDGPDVRRRGGDDITMMGVQLGSECIIVHHVETSQLAADVHFVSIRIIDAQTGEISESKTSKYNGVSRGVAAGLSLEEAYRLAADNNFITVKEVSTNK